MTQNPAKTTLEYLPPCVISKIPDTRIAETGAIPDLDHMVSTYNGTILQYVKLLILMHQLM